MARQNPVLLRRSLTGGVNALTRYTAKGGVLKAAEDGKHDVTRDYEELLLSDVLGKPGEDELTMQALYAAASGESLDPVDRAVLRVLWTRLRDIAVIHNEQLDEET